MLLVLALFFKCGCLFLQLRQSRVKEPKKKNRPCVQWDKCSSMNMIDFSQEDDDEIQIGIEHTKTM